MAEARRYDAKEVAKYSRAYSGTAALQALFDGTKVDDEQRKDIKSLLVKKY